ncbi:MAG: hypothetical protein CBC00_04445, partial [Verrucomicrobia bacterium TMED40]
MCVSIHGSESQVVIHWASETLSGHADLLKDSNGNLLNAGGAGNGDGCLVTLGYFEDGTTSDPFAGTWKPLTYGTRMGDSSSGYGYEDGMFLFTTVFTKSSDSVIVYPYRPASFTLTTQEILTDDLPEPGTPLCIRFYDGTDAGLTARYNTVTGSGWLWPGFPVGDGIPQNYYFKVARGTAPSGSDWEYGSIFEDSDHEFSAAKISEFNLSVNISGSGSVTSVSGSYEYGTVVELNATADDHMDFVGWLGDGVADPTLEITSITLNQDRNITAVFQDTIYSVLVNPLGNGSVSLSGDGNYTFGTIVNLNATPDPGYLFSHWNGFGPDSNISASTTLSVSQDHALVGVFTAQSFDLNVSSADSSHGLVEVVQSGPYIYDGNYTINASPNPGYAFSHWTSSSNSLGMLESNSSQTTNLILSNDAVFEGHFSLTTYQLEVLMGPGGQSVSPGTGQQSSIALVPVTAQPIDGYEFTKWEDPYGILINPNSPNTDANMSRASGDVSITAKFSTQTHDIIIIEGEGGNAQVSPSQGPWDHFGVYDVNATPYPGYFFTGWTGTTESTDCLVDSNFSNPDNQIWLLNPVTLTANFSQSTYLIDTGESEGGVVSGAGNYTINDTPILEANESIGWDFSEWTGSNLEFLSDPNSSITLVSLSLAPSYLQFDAIFVRETYDHNISVEGNGSVTFNGSNLLNQTLDSNSTVQLLAEPTTGWAFTQWFGSPVSGNTDPYISFIPLESSEIRAIFNRNKYDLTVNQTENGDANGSGTYDFEDQVPISATPITGYLFDEWTGDTSYLSNLTSPQTTVTIPAGNISITPQFRKNQYTLTVNPTENGESNGSGTYDFEDQVPISANPVSGYLFEEWTGDTSYLSELTSPQTIVTIPAGNVSITPQFRRNQYTLTVNPTENGDANGSGSYDFEDQVPISATPISGYLFDEWTGDTSYLSDPISPQTIVTIPAGNVSITPKFRRSQYTLTINQTQNGDANGSGSYDFEDQVSISATPESGYLFDEWTGDTSYLSNLTSPQTIVTIPAGNVSITPQFRRNQYTLTVNLTENGDANGSGIYDFENQVPISATPISGYLFDEWTGDTSYLSDPISPQTIVTIPSSNISITPTFKPIPFYISATTSDPGTISGTGDYTPGSTVSLLGTGDTGDTNAPRGYKLEKWSWTKGNGSTGQSSQNPLSFTADDNYTVIAYFSAIPPNEVTFSLVSDPTGSGILYDDPDKRIWDLPTDLYQRTISASPKTGYSFIGWSSTPILNYSPSWKSSIIETLPSENSILTANFLPTVHKVEVEHDPSQGTVSGSGTNFASNQQTTLTAQPNENYEFSGWTIDKT